MQTQSKLAAILKTKQARFADLAQAWLATGATAFSVWEGDTVIACWPRSWAANGSGMKNGLEQPIQISGQVLGKLRVEGVCNPEAQLRLAAEANLVIDLLKLEDELEVMAAELVNMQDQLVALYNLARSARTSLSIDQLLSLLLTEAIDLTKAKGGVITLNTSNHPILMEQQPQPFFDQIVLQNLYQQTQTTNHELLLPAEDPRLEALATNVGLTGFFLKTIPIRNKTTVMIGLLLTHPPTTISSYLKLARIIAEYAGAQLENMLLYQETVEQAKLKAELALAARIQLQLLPQKLPRVAGLDISATCIPALDVGGDFFDFIGQPDGAFTFVVGDVSGKGVSAALLMAMTRTVIRSEAKFRPTMLPGKILGQANAHLYDDFTDVGMFATVFLGYFDPATQLLTYTNAGHSPVIYCPSRGKAALLKAKDLPLGTIPVNFSENMQLKFRPGDLLVVATDGLNEAQNVDKEIFGYDRLLKLVEATAHKSAKEIEAVLFEAINEFGVNCPQDDDQTLVVIKVVEAAEESFAC